ncbi:restriction endonuclease subunit S [Rhodovarius crocodyli]|uniref:Restriction endonuclease subunit S n=1 Tax=Rhodovarius crocodyli TaxID=1979269 RepID=A0A437MG24_9PROT|nr:restriction endonuclease subunit S [Rhodovarius crocodyli]RVT96587.1 restriction endonuclease subunit S [Rhodovarius crocodyli]
MSFPAYPAYQDSVVEWLGEVPAHWILRRLGYYLAERREKVSDRDFPALSVTKSGIVPQLETAAKTDDGDNRKRVCAKDFVINGRSDRKGSSGLSTLDGSVSLINIVLYPHQPIEMEFVGHLLKSPPFQEEFYRYGKGIVADLWSTNFSEMRNILLAVPPPTEQSAIAAFLDRETGKIDALVAEQERLIALLKEKRQAVISHAVTKGLDPSVPMKDSGIEWLGQVPEHWNVRALSSMVRRGTTITYGIVQAGPDQLDGIPYIRTSDMSGSEFPEQGYLKTTPEIDRAYSRSKVEAGDLVVAIRATVGKTLKVPAHLHGANLTQGTARVSPGPLVDVEYLFLFLNSHSANQGFDAQSKGATFKEITLEMLRKFRVPLPPMSEQRSIVMGLGAKAASFDVLGAEATRAIALLRERRAALISAAVTGKIDVRGLVPETEVAA